MDPVSGQAPAAQAEQEIAAETPEITETTAVITETAVVAQVID